MPEIPDAAIEAAAEAISGAEVGGDPLAVLIGAWLERNTGPALLSAAINDICRDIARAALAAAEPAMWCTDTASMPRDVPELWAITRETKSVLQIRPYVTQGQGVWSDRDHVLRFSENFIAWRLPPALPEGV